ncbi:MAG: PAS domain-containing hybrid sensor histidine kinase/response regulator [Thermodesulfovibrionales bacterium]
MNKKLRILNLEDCQADTELIQARLEEEGIPCEVTRVETETEFVAAIEKAAFTLLLVDYKLPSFDGMSALAIARVKCPGTPFIFVSGSIGEDLAIEALKNGATDYVLKDKLTRLAPAVRRALDETDEKKEHKSAEQALLEASRFNRQIIECAQEGLIVYGPDLKYRVWNPFMEQLTGLSAREVLGRHPLEIFPFLRETGIMESIEKALAGEISEAARFHFHIPQTGRSGWTSDISAPLRSANGEIIGVIGIVRDISAHVQAEEALEKSERQYRQLVDNALIGVYRATLDGKFLYVNDAMVGIFECDNAEELLRLPVGARYKSRRDRKAFLTILKKQGKVPHFELDVPTKTGKLKTIVISAVLEEGIITGMVNDITEHKHLEEQLRHAQKMEAVGTLAGGIAHDFNNILNVIMGYGTLVLDGLGAADPLKAQMNEVLTAAERAVNLTRRLLVFSRKQVVEVKPVEVNETILDVQKMLARLIRENIDFKLDLAVSRLIVMADVGQIEQVLMNLASNARDAMPEGGRLTIGTGVEELDEEYVAAYGYGKPGVYALITVSDTGCGMDEETRKKIFEPFFTTKGVGEGTGLGLAISYEIVKRHNGYIQVYSEPGKGTIFKIYLPLVDVTAGADTKTGAAEAVLGGNETILVAEDDAALRKLTRIVLESFGYTVITAEDGEEAIGRFRENRDRIRLVMLDMIMPKKNGKEVSEVLRQESPGIKIIFASGYTMDLVKTRELTESGFDFIHKPVPPKDLLKKVRKILDR